MRNWAIAGTLHLKDKAGNPVDDLEVKHEKILHLIIVDEQLQKRKSRERRIYDWKFTS